MLVWYHVIHVFDGATSSPEGCWRRSPPVPTEPGADAIIRGDGSVVGNQTDTGNGTSAAGDAQPPTKYDNCTSAEKEVMKCKNGMCFVTLINKQRTQMTCKYDLEFAFVSLQ